MSVPQLPKTSVSPIHVSTPAPWNFRLSHSCRHSSSLKLPSLLFISVQKLTETSVSPIHVGTAAPWNFRLSHSCRYSSSLKLPSLHFMSVQQLPETSVSPIHVGTATPWNFRLSTSCRYSSLTLRNLNVRTINKNTKSIITLNFTSLFSNRFLALV